MKPHVIAQSIFASGIGGARLLDILERNTDIYPLWMKSCIAHVFYLLDKHKSLEEVKKRLCSPRIRLRKPVMKNTAFRVEQYEFFQWLNAWGKFRNVYPENGSLNYTLTALRLAKRANVVSQLHGEVSRRMCGRLWRDVR